MMTLCRITTLIHYDMMKPIIIACDASLYGLGAAMSYRMLDGTALLIAFTSRTLAPAELLSIKEGNNVIIGSDEKRGIVKQHNNVDIIDFY